MRVQIATIGRIKEPFILSGEAEYLKRLPSWCHPELIEIPTHNLGKLPPARYHEEQDRLLAERCAQGEILYILDERGDSLTSSTFADLLRKAKDSSAKNVTFAIGGPEGWGETTRARAHRVLALSALTFPHHFCRLLLIEQLYRASTIITGGSYHK